MDCLFCKIINREIPADFIYEDELVVAFLDIHPSNPGHLLIVPKKHAKDFLAASQEDITACLMVLKKIAPVLSVAFSASAFNIVQNNGADAGQIIQHLHWHLIPRYVGDPLRIYPHEKNYDDTIEEYKTKIKKALSAS